MSRHNMYYFISSLLLYGLFPLLSLGITSCDDNYEDVYYDIEEIDIHYDSDSLRVLVLGNSFSYDGTAYLEELSRSTNIDANRFCVYHGFIGSGGIKEWADVIRSDDSIRLNRMAGNIEMLSSAPMKEIVRQEWEVCVILQGSHQSYKWDSFENYTDQLISQVKSLCPNHKIKIAYAMPWSHTPANTPTELPGNIKCAWRLLQEKKVDFIIPVGIAIQNAREASLDNGKYLTRDDWHICYGVGRYVAACTWYEAVLEPFFHLSILGSDAIHQLTLEEENDPTSIPVTAENRTLCQRCAYYAVENLLNVTRLAKK